MGVQPMTAPWERPGLTPEERAGAIAFNDPRLVPGAVPMLAVLGDSLVAALRAAEAEGRRKALEEAARVAETRHELWRDGHFVECDVTACEDIATAIRTLAGGPA